LPDLITTMPTNRATARADTILSYINSITLSGRALTYPSSSTAEERAVQWLVEDDLGTAMEDEQSLRQRYVLGTFWFLQTTGHFGTDSHATTWASNLDECEWLDVECDSNGRVTALELYTKNVRGQLPYDVGLLTDMTTLSLSVNELSGTIPSSLGALTALNELNLWENQLQKTIPLSLGSLTELTVLDLGSNQLSGTIPSSFGALSALNGLLLNGNQLSGTIPLSLNALRSLTTLWLHDNQLVGTMPFCNANQSFDDLLADCAKVSCTCCTECCPLAFGNIPGSEYCET
jgi:hypothetical protein